MKLAEMEVRNFASVLASDAPAPGGGSVAGLEGALGAALTSMVTALTVGKKKYADVQAQAEETGEKARALKDQFIEIMDRDTETFNILSAAFGMPKATDEEKAARSAAIQEGLKLCTKVPYETMERSRCRGPVPEGRHAERMAQCAHQHRKHQGQNLRGRVPGEG